MYLQEIEFDYGDIDDPMTYQQAMKSPQVALWQQAIVKELESMTKNNVWCLVKPSINTKAVNCKWVFKTKRDAE